MIKTILLLWVICFGVFLEIADRAPIVPPAPTLLDEPDNERDSKAD